MFVCPTVSKLRFYGCYHPCLILKYAKAITVCWCKWSSRPASCSTKTERAVFHLVKYITLQKVSTAPKKLKI